MPRRPDDQEEEEEQRKRIFQAQEEQRASEEAEFEAHAKEAAVDEMVEWFNDNFEDPQNELPYDSEEGTFVFLWGGPFDANDMIGDHFANQYDQQWIDAAVEQVVADGVLDWAPTSHGAFYISPDSELDDGGEITLDGGPEEQPAEITARILTRLDELEAKLKEIANGPPAIGHNQPPDDVGEPPYDEDDQADLEAAVADTREEVQKAEPDKLRLVRAREKFLKIGSAVAKWVGRKADLAVDESIKATVKALAWGSVATLVLKLADDITALLRALGS